MKEKANIFGFTALSVDTFFVSLAKEIGGDFYFLLCLCPLEYLACLPRLLLFTLY